MRDLGGAAGLMAQLTRRGLLGATAAAGIAGIVACDGDREAAPAAAPPLDPKRLGERAGPVRAAGRRRPPGHVRLRAAPGRRARGDRRAPRRPRPRPERLPRRQRGAARRGGGRAAPRSTSAPTPARIALHRLDHDGARPALQRAAAAPPATRSSPPSTTSTPPTSRCGCAPSATASTVRRVRAVRRPGEGHRRRDRRRSWSRPSGRAPGSSPSPGCTPAPACGCRSGRWPTPCAPRTARRCSASTACTGSARSTTTPDQLGCDFLVSGCHKWLFGPRGTGLVWGRERGWARFTPTIPPFDAEQLSASGSASARDPPAAGPAATPGGYHSFEHRWALAEAFDLHDRIGRDRVAARTRDLATRLKDGLAGIDGVTLVTPRAAGAVRRRRLLSGPRRRPRPRR